MISEKNNFSVKLKNCKLWSDEPECWSKNFSYFSSLLEEDEDETSEAAWHKHISDVWQPPPEVSLEVPLLSFCHFTKKYTKELLLQSFYTVSIIYFLLYVKKRQFLKKWFRHCRLFIFIYTYFFLLKW